MEVMKERKRERDPNDSIHDRNWGFVGSKSWMLHLCKLV